MDQKELYPLLSALAMDIIRIPGSSAPGERTLSTVGEATTKLMNENNVQVVYFFL